MLDIENYISFINSIYEMNHTDTLNYVLSKCYLLDKIKKPNNEIFYIQKMCKNKFKFSAPEVLYYAVNVIGFCEYLTINKVDDDLLLSKLIEYQILQ